MRKHTAGAKLAKTGRAARATTQTNGATAQGALKTTQPARRRLAEPGPSRSRIRVAVQTPGRRDEVLHIQRGLWLAFEASCAKRRKEPGEVLAELLADDALLNSLGLFTPAQVREAQRTFTVTVEPLAAARLARFSGETSTRPEETIARVVADAMESAQRDKLYRDDLARMSLHATRAKERAATLGERKAAPPASAPTLTLELDPENVRLLEASAEKHQLTAGDLASFILDGAIDFGQEPFLAESAAVLLAREAAGETATPA